MAAAAAWFSKLRENALISGVYFAYGWLVTARLEQPATYLQESAIRRGKRGYRRLCPAIARDSRTRKDSANRQRPSLLYAF
jgi:hypothetical protein